MIHAKVNKEKTWYFVVGLTSVVWLPLYLLYSGVAVFGNTVTGKLGIEFNGLPTEKEGDGE